VQSEYNMHFKFKVLHTYEKFYIQSNIRKFYP